MGVIVDTSGQIYKKLDAANASLNAVLTGEAAIENDDSKILAAIAAAQTAIAAVLQEIETASAQEEAAIAAIATTIATVADQISQIYNFILKSPQTIGIDVTSVTSVPQPTPTNPGP